MVDRPGFEFPGVTLPGSHSWVRVRHTYFSHKFNESAPRSRGRGFLLFVIMSIGGTPPIPEEDGNLLGDLRGSLVYFVNSTTDYRSKYVTAANNKQYVRASWAQTLQVYYLGQYLGQPFNQFLRERLTRDRLTAYDAIYAVTYHEPLSEGSEGTPPPSQTATASPERNTADPKRQKSPTSP